MHITQQIIPVGEFDDQAFIKPLADLVILGRPRFLC